MCGEKLERPGFKTWFHSSCKCCEVDVGGGEGVNLHQSMWFKFSTGGQNARCLDQSFKLCMDIFEYTHYIIIMSIFRGVENATVFT